MRRQRNVTQMKEHKKHGGKELNKMGISNLLNAEFKTLIIRMLNELSENLNIIKRSNLKQRILTEIKNNLQGLNSRVNEV